MSPPSSSDHNNDQLLPPGWTKAYSNSQQKYYYAHKATNVTQWHFPTAREVLDPTIAKKRAAEAKEREQQKAKQQSGQRKKHKTNDGAAAAAADDDDDDFDWDGRSVAIIVPFRDLHVEQNRAAHLEQFVPHMIQFLSSYCKGIRAYAIYIVEQSDDGRKFNRGKLLNIGFQQAKQNTKAAHDVFIFHDVDLLPQPDLHRWYAKFPTKPLHIARVWDRYSNNPKYFGGVVSFSSSDYKRINGYPNNFWGWGGEDDEMQRRLERLGIQFDSPTSGTLKDLEEMDIQTKMNFLRRHKTWKCMVKWELKDEHETTWKQNGLADLKYKVIEKTSLGVNATKITVDVGLNASHWTNDKVGVDYMPPKDG